MERSDIFEVLDKARELGQRLIEARCVMANRTICAGCARNKVGKEASVRLSENAAELILEPPEEGGDMINKVDELARNYLVEIDGAMDTFIQEDCSIQGATEALLEMCDTLEAHAAAEEGTLQ